MFTSQGRWNSVLHVPYLCHRYLHNNFPLFIHMQFFSQLKLCHALFEYKLTRHKSYFIKLKWNNRPGYQQTKITLGFQLFNALKMRSCLILQRNLSQELHTYWWRKAQKKYISFNWRLETAYVSMRSTYFGSNALYLIRGTWL